MGEQANDETTVTPPKPLYKLGDESVDGQIVRTILGQTSFFRVYITEKDELRWEHEHDDEQGQPECFFAALQIFDSLLSDVKRYVPKKEHEEAFGQLGRALFTAVAGQDVEQISDAFYPSRHFIHRKAVDKARVSYLGAGLLSIPLVMLVLFLVGHYFSDMEIREYQLAVMFGVAGAMVSVLQRASSLHVDPFAPLGYLGIQGLSKILIGGIFGLIALLAIKAGLLLSIASDNKATLMLFSFVAGISERFIPEFLGRLEANPNDKAVPDTQEI